MRKRYIIWFLAWLGMASCNPEIDLITEYEDIPVVYGLLDKDEPIQYIRIQKAFLLNGNVLDAAKVPDSSKYDPADLRVRMVSIDPVTGEDVDTVHFSHQPGYLTEPGAIFPQNGAMLYTCNHQAMSPKWRLEVENLKTKKVATAQTGMVGGLGWISPGGMGSVSFTAPFTMGWATDPSVAIYQPQITFHWTEVDSVLGTSKPDSLVWDFLALEPGPGNPASNLTIEKDAFFKYVGEHVPTKPGVRRVIGLLTFKIFGGTEELAQYINLHKPSIGLIQDKPAYTNVQGGLGIFSSRGKAVVKMPLAGGSKYALITSDYTSGLNFSLD